jgi:hypothetical protein
MRSMLPAPNRRPAARRSTGLALLAALLSTPAMAARFQPGDVFAAVGDAHLKGQAEIFHYRADGTFVETLSLGPGIGDRSTGMAFDGSGHLLATAFDRSKIVRFDDHGRNLGVFIGSGLSFPEFIVFDHGGNFYVSSVLNPVGIRKYDAAGHFLAEFIPGTRVDWMDLAADQRTMLFTQESSPILRMDLSSERVTAFAATGGVCYALRILPDGSVLVANGEDIKLLDSGGRLLRTYDVPGQDRWFALNLTPDGTSFWSGCIDSGNLYKFDILCGGAADCGTFTQKIATGVPNEQPTRALAGLAVFGEMTVAIPEKASSWRTGRVLP